ncbi:NYN domain-containing protein [Actinophytocola sp.]|uniref:NYN domain-containing protein n=1 Tax=Actinophytocola sp. TaxID=1872138 RepID=UPI002D800263|nr:NYN domain-containing protein [Actinophytocola sp.]HET9143784.1 NYN domain-containing protein [Actinophytocola sp.]
MGNAVVCIDGMNLYHGLRAKYGRKYLWLDLYELATQLRRPDKIVRVRYFTTIVAGEPEAARRQEIYLAALTAHRPQVEVVRGRFKVKKFRCFDCGCRYTCDCDPAHEYRTFEEKLTDVALGVAMVRDAAQGYGDLSVLITTDTDLTPAINATAEIAPDRPIYLACPPGRQPPQARHPPSVTSFLIGRRHVAASLLPARVVGSRGQIYARPDKWR